MPSEEDMRTLLQARERAKRLLEELVKKQAEVEASPPPINPEQLQAGRAAMENAIAAARRMLRRLDEALAMGLNPVDEPEDEPDDNAN